MTAMERQDTIMAMLRKERSITVDHLAEALDCSRSTIKRDLIDLSINGFPVISRKGRYGGGIELADWYQPTRTSLCPEQLKALRDAMSNATDPQMRAALGSIIDQFGPKQR